MDVGDPEFEQQPWRLAHRRIALAVATFSLLICGLGSPATALLPDGRIRLARSARSIAARDTAYLRFVPSSGADFLEVGSATGTLPGSVRAYVNFGNPLLVRFTIYTHRGSITGQGSAPLKGNPEKPSFSGAMTISHGTGAYKHAHGSGNFYGYLNRKSKNAVVQTVGTFAY